MRMIRKYAAAAVMFLLFLVTAAYADTVAEYKIEFDNYDSGTKTYTAQVYLDTTEYLSAGTFGMAYDASMDLSFDLETDLFSCFKMYGTEDDNYIAFQWTLNDIEPLTGKLHLGTITVNNVSLDSANKPLGWYQTSIRQLDWMTTSMSKTAEFMVKDGDLSLNEEIWRILNEDEQKSTGLNGYYQGYYQGYDDFHWEHNPQWGDPEAWLDIGFLFNSGYDLPQKPPTISGSVRSFNPNNAVTVNLYKAGESEPFKTTTAVDKTVYTNGRVVSEYEFSSDDLIEGEYMLEIIKDVHLTYKTGVKVVAGRMDYDIDMSELICGDIMKDGKVKLYDRTALLRYMNNRNYVPESDNLALRSDLNGDGRVTLYDLSIMKVYFNKTYKEAV